MSARRIADWALVAAGVSGLVRFVVVAAASPGVPGAGVALLAATMCAAAAWLGWFDLERARLLAEARGRQLGAGLGKNPAPGWRLATGLGALFLLASLLVGAALEGALRSAVDQRSAGARSITPRRTPAEDPEPPGRPDPDAPESTTIEAAVPVGPTGASPSPGPSPEAFPALFSTRTVLEIEELDPGRTWVPPSMHLRAFAMDRYGPRGAPVEHTLADPLPLEASGRRGLRVENPLDEPLAPAGREALRRELEVRFVEAPNGVVFSPRRLALLDAGDVLRDPRAALLRLPDRRQRRYRMTVEEPRIAPRELRVATARGSLPGAPHLVALPPAPSPADAAAMARLRELAESWTSGASSDAARVMAVVTRLRMDNGYLLQDTRFTGPAACVDVLERRAGSCTQFASTAMVMLRTLGVPTRIAVGYLVTATKDEDPNTWIARECDGHAWIEVHFDGLGWLTYDPTPADELGGGALTGWAPVDPGEGLRTEPRSAFGAVAARTFGWLGGSGDRWITGWGGGLLLCAVLALGLQGGRRLFRWRPGERDQADEASDGRPNGAWSGTADGASGREDVGALVAELFAALSRRGHDPSRNETTLAFGRRVDLLETGSLGPVTAALTRLLRCSCKGVALTGDEQREIRSLCQALGNRGGNGPPTVRT